VTGEDSCLITSFPFLSSWNNSSLQFRADLDMYPYSAMASVGRIRLGFKIIHSKLDPLIPELRTTLKWFVVQVEGWAQLVFVEKHGSRLGYDKDYEGAGLLLTRMTEAPADLE
jgi:hypothetical protein